MIARKYREKDRARIIEQEVKCQHQRVAFYPQEWDATGNLTTEPLLNVLKLTLEWIKTGGKKII